MALKNDRYAYRVTWSEDDNEHVGLTDLKLKRSLMIKKK